MAVESSVTRVRVFINTMRISKVVVAISLIFLSKAETNKNNNRFKRANQDNFNILLNMYKLNPLKHSTIFKSFSNHVFLPRKDLDVLNLNTKESIDDKQYRIDFKKRYGEILHYTAENKLNKGALNVDYFKTESFNSEHLDNLLSLNQINADEKNNDDDIFENVFVPPTIARNQVKESITYKADKANTIDSDPNIYISKKTRKRNKKRYLPNAEIILA